MNGYPLKRACRAAVAAGGMMVALASDGNAQTAYCQHFEAPGIEGSSDGSVLTGQDGYYLPNNTSVDHNAYTYEGNVLGIPQNPDGGDQFIAGVGPGTGDNFFARAQRDMSFEDSEVWTYSYDACVTYLGDKPSAQNVGSFSLQPSTTAAIYIHLFTWVDVNTPDTWNAFYLAYDEAGTQFAQPGESPGDAWANLEINQWYRFSTTVNYTLNNIVEVSITDIETGETTTAAPQGWFLQGGEAGGFALPTAFRFFAGSNTAFGNTIAWDNAVNTPGTTSGINETCEITFGSDPDGDGCDVANLDTDDDLVEAANSDPGLFASEPNVAELTIFGTTGGGAELTAVRTRDSGVLGLDMTCKIQVRDQVNGGLDTIGEYLVANGAEGSDLLHHTYGCSSDYIGSKGEYEVRLRYVSPAVLVAGGFNAFVDEATALFD